MLITDALALPLFHRALTAGLLVSVACGIVGTLVVVKRISSISGGLSHAAFGGVGLGYLLGFSPMLGALGFCVACAGVLAYTYRRRKQSLDTLISMLWSAGMALGMLFIALSPGYVPDLSSYLFGSIIFVPAEYIHFALALDVLVVLTVLLAFNRIQAVCFDEEFSEISGVKVDLFFLLLTVLTALTVVTLIRVAGVILTIALLTTPAVIARHWSSSLGQMMSRATALTAASIAAGLFFAYWLSAKYGVEAPTGPVIILLLTTVYVASLVLRAMLGRGELR